MHFPLSGLKEKGDNGEDENTDVGKQIWFPGWNDLAGRSAFYDDVAARADWGLDIFNTTDTSRQKAKAAKYKEFMCCTTIRYRAYSMTNIIWANFNCK